jgi:hypothetical protein
MRWGVTAVSPVCMNVSSLNPQKKYGQLQSLTEVGHFKTRRVSNKRIGAFKPHNISQH